MPLYLLCINAKGAEGSGVYSLREGTVYTAAGSDQCGGCQLIYVMLEEQPVNGMFSIAVCSRCGRKDKAPPYWSWDPRRFIQINDPKLWEQDLTKIELKERLELFVVTGH